MTLRFGSLFSGIGGFDEGFERAGMECAWQCEIDPHARTVLAKHWPGVPCYDDVRAITAGGVPMEVWHRDVNGRRGKPYVNSRTGPSSGVATNAGDTDGDRDTYPSGLPRVDLICGGFPCQDVSVAGRRAGLAGERSGLWFEFRRVLAELRPRWVIVENVPGLRSSNRGRDLAVILRGLAELGYMGSFWSPDAQWFGVAQRRERVFIVGHLGDGRAVEVLPVPEGMCGNPPASRTAGEEVAGTLGGSLGRGSSGGPRNDLDGHGAYVISRRGRDGGSDDEIEQSGVAPALRAGDGESSRAVTVVPVVAIQDTRAMEKAQNGIGVNESGVGYTLDGTGAQGVYVPDVVGALNGGGLNGQDAYSGRIFAANSQQMAVGGYWDGSDVAATLDVSTLVKRQTMPEKGRFAAVIQYARPRRLTPTECERLQGFPDGWTAGQADSHRYKQLGNAVAVPVAEWIGRRIVAATENPAKGRGSDGADDVSAGGGRP